MNVNINSSRSFAIAPQVLGGAISSRPMGSKEKVISELAVHCLIDSGKNVLRGLSAQTTHPTELKSINETSSVASSLGKVAVLTSQFLVPKGQNLSSSVLDSPKVSRETRLGSTRGEAPVANDPAAKREDVAIKGINHLRQALNIDQFQTEKGFSGQMQENSRRLAEIEKRGSVGAAQDEANVANGQRVQIQVLLNMMRQEKLTPGETEKNAYKFYYAKEADANKLVQQLRQEGPQRIEKAEETEKASEALRRLRKDLNIEQFTTTSELETLTANYRSRFEKIESRGDTRAAQSEFDIAQAQRIQLQVMLNIMKDLGIDRGNNEQNAYKFYYTKSANAEALMNATR